MTLTEAVEIVRHLQGYQAERMALDNRDPMLQTVCRWRNLPEWPELLEAALKRPHLDTHRKGRVKITQAQRLLDRLPASQEELCSELGLTRSYLAVAVSRLRADGHPIETVRAEGVTRYRISAASVVPSSVGARSSGARAVGVRSAD